MKTALQEAFVLTQLARTGAHSARHVCLYKYASSMHLCTHRMCLLSAVVDSRKA